MDRRAFVLTLPAALVGGTAAMANQTYKSYQAPTHAVTQRFPDFEVRDYAPQLLAAVTVKGTRDKALGQGFRILAGYIFGANQGSAKVAMTVPVAQTPEQVAMTVPVTQTAADGSDAWTVTFMFPSGWTKETAPVPNNAAIRIVEHPAETLAVHQFSGWAGAGRIEEKATKLRWAMNDAGIAPAGPFRSLFYDDPFTVPWNRRNEVAYPV
ncbi:MAG: heme-binding protein [Pseudomonadota bacterium]